MKFPLRSFNISRLFALMIAFVITRYFVEGISTTLSRSIECLLLIWIIYEYVRVKPSIKYTGRYINSVVTVLILWNVFIVIRGNWNISLKEIIFKVIGLQGVILYLLPFLFFLPYNYLSVKKILKTLFYASLFVIPLWIINLNLLIQTENITGYRAEGVGGYLPFFCAFLLPISFLFGRKERYFVTGIFLIYFLLMLINARRNIIISFFLYALIAYLIRIKFVNKKQSARSPILFISVFIIGLVFLINFDFFMRGPLSYLNSKILLDTRSEPEKFFFADFSKSSIGDWFMGRGLDGTYTMRMRNLDTNLVMNERSVIETGYLDMILKGGIIYDLLILMILIPAAYRAIKSKNLIKVVSGFFLFTYLIDLYTTSPLSSFGVRSILFWFCVSVCYRKDIFFSKSFFLKNMKWKDRLKRIKETETNNFVYFKI